VISSAAASGCDAECEPVAWRRPRRENLSDAILQELSGMAAITIVGAGGIGCAVGYALAASGPVTFVESSAAKIDDGLRHGVRVDGLPARRADFISFDDWRPAEESIVLLCTKCYDNARILERLPGSVRLLPIQNGFDEQLQGRPPHVEGIASFVSECIPGTTHTRITRPGRLHLGPAGNDDRLGTLLLDLSSRLRSGPFALKVVDDILPYKHAKLMYNSAISPLASAAGIDNGSVLRHKPVRSIFFELLRENHSILTRAGVPLGQVGPLHPATVAKILARPWLAHALAWAFYPGLRGTYCSMANDLPAGRTEIENYNGYLIRLAGDGPCPLNRQVYDLVKTMESQRLKPGLERLAGLRTGW
jgi:2-dehydropantoate 2-reductase